MRDETEDRQHLGRNGLRRGNRMLMLVTADRFELPVAAPDTLSGLAYTVADAEGKRPETVASRLCQAKRRGGRVRALGRVCRVVEVELGRERRCRREEEWDGRDGF